MNSCKLLKSGVIGSVSSEVCTNDSSGVVRIEAVFVPTPKILVELNSVLPVASVNLIDADGGTTVPNSLCVTFRLHPSQGREETVDGAVGDGSCISLLAEADCRKEDDRREDSVAGVHASVPSLIGGMNRTIQSS